MLQLIYQNKRGDLMIEYTASLEKVKLLMEREDLTNYKIAKETGLSQETIWRIRKGETKIERMNFENVAKLTAYYDKLEGEDK